MDFKECPLPLLQDYNELEKFINICNSKGVKSVLEIGSFYGGTLWCWLKSFNELKDITCIDMPVPSSDSRYEKMMESRNQWKIIFKDINFTNIQGDSTSSDIINKINGKFDLLFIDGGHDYQTVKNDYENYNKFVNEGGIIAFHDAIGLGDVNRFWNEIKRGKSYIEICNNNTVGWGIGLLFI